MKKLFYCLIFCILFALPNVVKAETYLYCEQYNLLKLQKLASNITYSYDYVETFKVGSKYGDVSFKVTIYNLDPRIYLYDRNKQVSYVTPNRELVFNNIKPGTSLEFIVHGNDYGCKEELMTVNITVPFYNKYYVDELCEKFPDNELCDKWRLVDLTYEEFAKKIEHDRIVEGGFDDQVDDIKTFKDYFVEIVSFLDEYKFIIFGSVIILSGLGIIYLKSLKKKDNFDLK